MWSGPGACTGFIVNSWSFIKYCAGMLDSINAKLDQLIEATKK